jgi:biopolymer transport protein ExbD
MAMSAGPVVEGEPLSDINTTPLIDVMLVLLIMLIVTLPPQRHAIKLDTPLPNKEQAPILPEVVRIQVDFDGSLSWNGSPIGLAELEIQLAAQSKKIPQPEIHIEPYRTAKYGVVAHVMASAQRHGLTKLGVLGGT